METQKQMVPGAAGKRLISVGHSNHDLERFVRLLRNAGITAVADVRSRPYSGRFPHFNGPELERELPGHGIAYLFLGDSLGGRPGQPSLYDAEGRVDYRRVRKTQAFEEGLDRLCRELDRFTTAMLCSEEDPLHCHRGLMIAPAMLERGQATWHLRGDGSLESTEQCEARLLAETRVGAGILDGLFAATVTDVERGRLLLEAYEEQARRKAFRLPPGENAEHDDWS